MALAAIGRGMGGAVAAAGLWTLLLLGAAAHEGHDHGAPPPAATGKLAPRAEATSANFEIVAVPSGSELVLHLDGFADNAPVEGAVIELDTPEGTQTARAAGPGSYVVAAPFAAVPGTHDLALTITAGGAVDVLTATLVVPPTTDVPQPRPQAGPYAGSALAPGLGTGLGGQSAALLLAVGVGFGAGVVFMRLRRGTTSTVLLLAAALPLLLAGFAGAAEAPAVRDASQRLPDGTVIVPKPSQRILGLRTLLTATGTHAQAVELPGRIVPDANASGLVQASVGGRLAPPEGGFKPLGTRVKAGDILAYVYPPISASDLKDLEQQGHELDQQIAIVKRRYERLSAIRSAVTQKEVEETEIELQGLMTRRATLERVQREPEALRAPVSGVIAAADAVAGQMAEPSAVVFRIVDPNRLWVEALSFSPDAGRAGAEGRLPDGGMLALAYLGAGLSDRNQAVPVHFAVSGAGGGLRLGQFLTVLATTGEARAGIALPREAVVRGINGQSIVFEHASAERFVPREVRALPLDASRVLVTSGLEPGRRVVTRGAELIDQIR